MLMYASEITNISNCYVVKKYTFNFLINWNKTFS